ncbi:MAG: NCS2 family permease [candidate division WOR-3 bacterium]
MFENLFKLKENNTNIKTEILAGITTFMTMAYIIAANPLILQAAGMDKGAVTLATCIVAGLISIAMGLLSNYPIALAPGMGLNAFFAYSICAGMGIDWRIGLGFFFIEGVIIVIITLTKLREIIIDSIPFTLKCAVSVGIGLFLAFIGFEQAGLITKDPVTFVKISPIANSDVYPKIILAGIVLVITTILLVKRIKGAILIGILLGTLLSFIPFFRTKGEILQLLKPSLAPTFFKLDIIGALQWSFVTLIFTLLFVDFFDTAGTVIGLAVKAKFIDEKGHIPRIGRVLFADSLGPVVGALVGTSTVTSYIESAAGIEEGGRTGLTAVTTGILFLIAIFAAPLVGFIPSVAIAPALIIVGIMMMESVIKIDFSDYSEAVPAFITIASMPFTYSISNGISLGFLSYVLIKLFSGKGREVSVIMYILAIFFLIFFITSPVFKQ